MFVVLVLLLSRVQLFVIRWTAARQAPLSMEFSRQEYWNGLPLLSPRDLLHPGIESVSPTLAGGFFTTEPPGKPKISRFKLLYHGYKRECPYA